MPLPMLSVDRRRELAKLVGVGEQYLYQIQRGLGTASPALARQLNAIEPTMTLQDLRPDDWQIVWPELAESEPKQPVALTSQALVATETVVQGVAHV